MTDSVANGGCCSGSVRPGTYGDALDIPQITVDRCGRIVKISNVAISSDTSNLVVANSVTTTNVFAVRYYGDGGLLSNINHLENNSNYFSLLSDGSFVLPNNQLDVGSNPLTVRTQYAMTMDWNDGAGSLTELNINSGGVSFEVATPSLTTRWYFNPDGSTVLPGNVFATQYYGDGGLLTNVSTFTQPLANLVVSNSVTTTNVFADTEILSNSLTVPNLNVTGSLTANAANATFFFDTFTIPYINTQYLNVSSNITLTGNLSAPLANIATLNVGYLTVNSAVVYGASTLNVYGTSNLTNVFAATETLTGTTGQTTLNVTGNLYVSNALTTTNLTCTGFTSNISNTIFNYDTVVIPFLTSATMNVTSTSNLQTVTTTLVTSNFVTTPTVAPTIASAATIAPTASITFVSGTEAIATITVPSQVSSTGGSIILIPTGVWTTTTAGNIALATTAVVSKALQMTYDATTTKWYPSY